MGEHGASSEGTGEEDGWPGARHKRAAETIGKGLGGESWQGPLMQL